MIPGGTMLGVVVLYFLIFTGTQCVAGCPEGHTQFGNNCYFPSFKDGKDFVENKDWTDARKYCRELSNEYPTFKYDLVSLQSEDEYNFILNTEWSKLYKKWKSQFGIWIGLNDKDNEGEWEWSDGSALEYGNPVPNAKIPPWKKGEPSQPYGDEDCVRTYGLEGLTDRKCNEKMGFICEGKPEVKDPVGNPWRNDGRCGDNYPVKNGKPGQCDPTANANEKGPCCSSGGWCGNSAAHCDCSNCVNYTDYENNMEELSNNVKLGKCFANPPSMSYIGSRDNMVPNLCKEMCGIQKYKYAGVKWRKECWCGNSPPLGKLKDDKECNLPCSGDKNLICGGNDEMNIYEPDDYEKIMEKLSNNVKLGKCFANPPSMSYIGSRDNMVPNLCKEMCGFQKYKYAGVKWRKECWCGNSPPLGKLKDDKECNLPCKGDKNLICGGNDEMNIYEPDEYEKIVEKLSKNAKFGLCLNDQPHSSQSSPTKTPDKRIQNLCKQICGDQNVQLAGIKRQQQDGLYLKCHYECRDKKLEKDDCKTLAKQGYCRSISNDKINFKYMTENCPEACGVCGDFPDYLLDQQSCSKVSTIPSHVFEKKIGNRVDYPAFYGQYSIFTDKGRVMAYTGKYTEAYGLPITSSKDVDDRALMRLCYVVRFLYASHKKFKKAAYDCGVRFVVIGQKEGLTDVPAYSWLSDWWNGRARGLGGKAASGAEENMLAWRGRSWGGMDVAVHEVAHNVELYGMRLGMRKMYDDWGKAYDSANKTGKYRWKNGGNSMYGISNHMEYFATGVASYVGDTWSNIPPHNAEQLKKYDPTRYEIIKKALFCNDPDVFIYQHNDIDQVLSRQSRLRINYPDCELEPSSNIPKEEDIVLKKKEAGVTYTWERQRCSLQWTNKSNTDDGSCYSDSPRLLDYSTSSTTNTPDECKKTCSSLGYFFAGVQWTNECWCGNDDPPSSKIVDSSQCNMVCAGDASQKCGAGKLMNIYRTDKTTFGGCTHEGTDSWCPTATENGKYKKATGPHMKNKGYCQNSNKNTAPKTCSKTASGKPCILPFLYLGVKHETCQYTGWCATKVDGDMNMLEWSTCDPSCYSRLEGEHQSNGIEDLTKK